MSWNPVRLDVATYAEGPLVPAHLGVHSQGVLFLRSPTQGFCVPPWRGGSARFAFSPAQRLPAAACSAPTERPWAGAEPARSCRTPGVQFPSPTKTQEVVCDGLD